MAEVFFLLSFFFPVNVIIYQLTSLATLVSINNLLNLMWVFKYEELCYLHRLLKID